jgi:Putative Flp pilus-assembly TadE/G-like
MTDRRTRSQASGQALPLFAIFAPAILALMAVGLDAAHVFLERRDAQGAADLAALSGARELPDDPTSAIATADSVGVANGYPAAQVFPVTPYTGDDSLIEVTITTNVDTFFMPILDFFVPGDYSSMTVSARAVAEAEESGGSGDAYAIFTLQPCGSSEAYKSIDWSGSTTDITGSIHSSGGILIGGSTNTVNGEITYECSNQYLESGTNAQIPPRANPQACPGATTNTPCLEDQSPPILPPYATFRTTLPCDFPRNGDWNVTGSSGTHWFNQGAGQLKAGKYCATGKLEISNQNISVVPFAGKTGITLVADKVHISGSNFDLLPPYDSGILAYANSNQADAIKFAGSDGAFQGLLYAPRGTVETSGSTNSTLQGAIVSYNVKLNGSSLDIVGTFVTGPAAEQTLALIE